MLVILPSSLDLTHSLPMNKPRGWVYFTPLGAVRSIERSDMVLLWRRKANWLEFLSSLNTDGRPSRQSREGERRSIYVVPQCSTRLLDKSSNS